MPDKRGAEENLRSIVRGSVVAFDAATSRERRSKRTVLAQLERLARPFDRESSVTHVTGSAIMVSERGVLLHVHKRLGEWLQPGGHLEGDEAPWAAAQREAKEETGISGRHPDGVPRLFHIDVHPAGMHLHLDLRYLLICRPEDPAPPPSESQAVQWFSLSEALAVADKGLVDGIARLHWMPSVPMGARVVEDVDAQAAADLG